MTKEEFDAKVFDNIMKADDRDVDCLVFPDGLDTFGTDYYDLHSHVKRYLSAHEPYDVLGGGKSVPDMAAVENDLKAMANMCEGLLRYIKDANVAWGRLEARRAGEEVARKAVAAEEEEVRRMVEVPVSVSYYPNAEVK